MNYSRIDFGATVYRGHCYFLVGSDITNSTGIVSDPWIRFQVLTRMVMEMRGIIRK